MCVRETQDLERGRDEQEEENWFMCSLLVWERKGSSVCVRKNEKKKG